MDQHQAESDGDRSQTGRGAFVGGSLVPIGGHNLLEPAAQGAPIVTGPHLFNTQEIAEKFVELGACRIVANSDGLAPAIRTLIENPVEARTMGDNGRAVLEQNRGALQRLLVLLKPLLIGEKSRNAKSA